MNSNSPETQPEPSKPHENERSITGELLQVRTAPDMGRIILARVMNLEGHTGVTSSDGEGGYRYSPDNQQYPDQGDFAFAGETAFDTAVTRGYPNYLDSIHILSAHKDDVVEPYPDDMPGVVYVKNGADVIAKKVPREVVDAHVSRINAGQEPLSTSEVLDKLS